MQLRYTILYVDDVPATLDRFERAFGLQRGMLHESQDYAELATGPTRLAFSSRSLMQQLGKEPGRAEPSRPVFEIAFEVPAAEVSSAFAQATEAGFLPVQPPRDEAWGQTTSYVSDPVDGFLIEICSPVSAPQS